jgi:hypothetical protein
MIKSTVIGYTKEGRPFPNLNGYEWDGKYVELPILYREYTLDELENTHNKAESFRKWIE